MCCSICWVFGYYSGSDKKECLAHTNLDFGDNPKLVLSGAQKAQVEVSKIKLACKTLRGYARVFPIGKPQAYLWQGVFEWLLGHQGKAQKLWQKGLAVAQELEMPYDAALLHYQLARRLAKDDPNRQAHLQQAAEIFEQLHVQPPT